MVCKSSSQTLLISALQEQIFSLIFNCPLRGSEVIELKLKRARAIDVEIPKKGDCVVRALHERLSVCCFTHSVMEVFS